MHGSAMFYGVKRVVAGRAVLRSAMLGLLKVGIRLWWDEWRSLWGYGQKVEGGREWVRVGSSWNPVEE